MAVDFAGLRNRTLADGQDSEVTVNTRALIDKVLARYSSEHTTLRELIQNASDAGANTVSIKFESDPSPTIPVPQGSDRALFLKHVIQHHTLKRLTVSNNGQPFTSADWNRLKSIAEGNPDETKIGAFGVGFYSVFADCDEPFVVSGDKTMAFYWKGNTLSTKIATVPSEHVSANTTFLLDYRQANPASSSYSPSKIPNLTTLCRFLATSLTFVGLESIELHLDEFRIACLTKKTSPPSEIRVPQELKTDTEGGLMRVTKVTRQHSQIDAEWSNVIATAQNPPKRAAEIVQAEVKNAGSALKSFFSRFNTPSEVPSKTSKPMPAPETNITYGEDIAGDSKGIIFLQICTVEVETRVSRTFSAEIERATKKTPPRKTRIALLTSPYHDPSTSLSSGSGPTADLASKIFQEVLPTTAGRIFIGSITAQTTPFLAHVSAPSLIPTVERENVDMNARYISTWNFELLRVAGLACRISYSSDIAELRGRMMKKEPISALISQANYICKQYTANVSHPSTALGQMIEDAFFDCSKVRAIAVLSTNGVKSSQYVRMPAETLSFLGDVPMVPQELARDSVTFFVNLHKRGFISELTMADIRDGLDSRALSEEELTEFLRWCGAKLQEKELDSSAVRSLFDVTVANINVGPQGNSGRILPLGSIVNYVNASRITPGLPVPQETIPFVFSKAVPIRQLQMFGWSELSIVQWVRFLTSGAQLKELITSEQLAAQVLGSASRSWDQMDNASKEAVVGLLSPHAVLPTKMGMCRPGESYFPTVKLFDDLPTVKPFSGSKEKFLVALGVRKTVELSKVFDRMKTGGSGWNHGDLIRYFASVIDEIPRNELERLRQTPFLPGQGSLVPKDESQSKLFKAQDLFAPGPAILALGLTQVKLPFEFKESSKEGALLLRLGLKKFPNSETIATILYRAGQSNDEQLWRSAISYFVQNYFPNGYGQELSIFVSITAPILPTEQAPFPNLVAPFQCFTNEKAACLGYAILKSDLRPHADKFGIRQDPDIKDCVQRLISSPPKTKADAEEKFTYLALRSSELEKHPALLQDLSSAKIVPIFRKYYLEPKSVGFEDYTKQQTGKSEHRIHHYDAPVTVFVGSDREFIGILDYVQYSSEATALLLKAGAKHEPTSHDLAFLLCRNPSRFLNTIGQDRYLGLLRKLADHSEALFKDKELVKALEASRVLLGYRELRVDEKKLIPVEEDTLEDLDDAAFQREWSLNRAGDVAIIDDVQYWSMFRDFIIAAPEEEQLEEFYSKLGTRKISDLVQSSTNISVKVRDQSPAQGLHKTMLERARLFLHEYERDATIKGILHDVKWLNSNLTVECVSDISIRYALMTGNVTKSSRTTACVRNIRGRGLVMSITPRYDTYEVSKELVKLLIRRPKQNDTIGLERFLTESLRGLRAKGINVDRILRRKDYEARVAKQLELEQREQQERQHQEEQKRIKEKTISRHVEEPEPVTPGPEQDRSRPVEKEPRQVEEGPRPGAQTPEKPHNMPGSFGSPEDNNVNENASNANILSDWAKKLGFKTPAPPSAPSPPSITTGGPQINKDLQATKSNLANAIKECRPTNMGVINNKHHQDPTELDRGGYCNGEQWENLAKAFTVAHSGRNVDIYFGKSQTEAPADITAPLNSFLPIIFGLTSVFGVNPAAVNIFLDDKSNTVAFNMSGSLFFNMAWFIGLHADAYGTVEGRQRAWDSWFLTYCHELAHNLVSDHNARHNWYNQQMAIEYSQPYRAALREVLAGLG